MVKNKVEYDQDIGRDKQVDILKKKFERHQHELQKILKQLNDCA